MSKFGCIYFGNDNIILSKEDLEKTKVQKVFLEPINYLGSEGYNIYIISEPNSIPDRVWEKIEKELLMRDIFYIAINNIELPYEFEVLQIVKGEDIKALLSPYILDYIFKYELIRTDPKYAKIGIIGGRINKTLDVMIPIVDKVTDMVLFTEEPEVYRDIVKEVYNKTKLRIKLMYPNSKIMEEMDIIYDVNERTSYSNWSNVHAIYIDFFRDNNKSKKVKLDKLPPRIWYDFNVVCEKCPMDKSILEAILYTDGFTRSILRRKIKSFNISISRVYTVSKS